jgi:excisionase family DNA binding protein
MSAGERTTPGERQDDGVPELWKVERVCEVLELSPPSVYKLMDSGQLPYVRFGRCRRVKKSEVLALIARQTVAGG